MPGCTSAVVLFSAIWVILLSAGTARASGACELAKLTASDAEANDLFGYSVAIGGEALVVGAYFDDDGGDNSGSAYVYRFDGTTWVEEDKLTASDAAAGDGFGFDVSISEDVAVAGVYQRSNGGPGAAYVYRFNGVSWDEEGKLLASDGVDRDEFGWSVSISGNVALIGTLMGWMSGDRVPGSAYVYRFDGAEWIEEAKLQASDGEPSDFFGSSVSINADVALIGAQGASAAYVYRFDGTDWIEEAKLTTSDSLADAFGFSVSVSGGVAVIGAPYSDDAGWKSGWAYVFRFNGTDWIEEARLAPSDGAFADRFGDSVSISEDTAIIGAYYDDYTSGSAYLYRFDGEVWVETAKMTASDSGMHDSFAMMVSISGDAVVIGAHGQDDACPITLPAYAEFQNCFSGDGVGNPEQACWGYDMEPDGDVDLADYDQALNRYCNSGAAYVFSIEGGCDP